MSNPYNTPYAKMARPRRYAAPSWVGEDNDLPDTPPPPGGGDNDLPDTPPPPGGDDRGGGDNRDTTPGGWGGYDPHDDFPGTPNPYPGGTGKGAPGTWKDLGYVDIDGMVTLPWGERVTLAAAMNMYYRDGRQPQGGEVPPWVLGGWSQATGTPGRQYQNAPSWFGSTMQNLYNQTYTNAMRAGQPPVNVAGTAVSADYWKNMGWVDPDGKVTLPTGNRVTLAEAMNLYYEDSKPAANSIPAWARASVSPIQYINSIPAHLRGVYESMLNQAYPAGSANRPAVAYMQGQAPFR
jgi:hypothetical protein